MEAPKSLKQKEGEPTMSYINKGNCDFAWNRASGSELHRWLSFKKSEHAWNTLRFQIRAADISDLD